MFDVGRLLVGPRTAQLLALQTHAERTDFMAHFSHPGSCQFSVKSFAFLKTVSPLLQGKAPSCSDR